MRKHLYIIHKSKLAWLFRTSSKIIPGLARLIHFKIYELSTFCTMHLLSLRLDLSSAQPFIFMDICNLNIYNSARPMWNVWCKDPSIIFNIYKCFPLINVQFSSLKLFFIAAELHIAFFKCLQIITILTIIILNSNSTMLYLE